MPEMFVDHAREAMLYERQPGGRVLCQLCPHRCVIAAGQRGICQVRENRAGTLYTLAYQTVTEQVDSVEKKPLFHFHPGSTAYSIATQGCNFRCQYCTNWVISQSPDPRPGGAGLHEGPAQIVSAAVSAGCRSIAYTYVEPTIFFELVYETARLARAAGLANVYKTNGYLTAEAFAAWRPYMDAANVDLKSFRDTTYRRFGGQLQPVLDVLQWMKASGVWVEVTTVIIPGVNDDAAELREAAEFIARELGRETPWHLARFFPAYRMSDVPPTPVETLLLARDLGRAAGLAHVYFGNLPLPGSQDTACADCGHVLIRRRNAELLDNVIKDEHCPRCGAAVPGVGF